MVQRQREMIYGDTQFWCTCIFVKISEDRVSGPSVLYILESVDGDRRFQPICALLPIFTKSVLCPGFVVLKKSLILK